TPLWELYQASSCPECNDEAAQGGSTAHPAREQAEGINSSHLARRKAIQADGSEEDEQTDEEKEPEALHDPSLATGAAHRVLTQTLPLPALKQAEGTGQAPPPLVEKTTASWAPGPAAATGYNRGPFPGGRRNTREPTSRPRTIPPTVTATNAIPPGQNPPRS